MVSNTLIFLAVLCREQPPPRGCVLKRFGVPVRVGKRAAAAFERLCVETLRLASPGNTLPAAAFERLCVETFGIAIGLTDVRCSRLRAAVC